MKTNAFRSTLFVGAVLALGSGVAIPAAIAGPAERATRPCTDTRLVNVTETKPSWHNARGPLVTTKLGTRFECTSCDTPMVVMKPSGHNARGAMAPVEIKGKHECTKNICGPSVATGK